MTVALSLRQLEDLRFYQPTCIDFLVQHPRCAALLRPGLGKTICALLGLIRLGVRRTLVVAPAQVVESEVWSQEAAAWAPTAHLRVVELNDEPPREWSRRGDGWSKLKPREKLEWKLLCGADVFVVSYDKLWEITEYFQQKRLVRNNYFDAIIYDELSKMKHSGTRRFDRMRFWAQDIPVRFGLTGSPLGNHWQDIWGEMFVTAGPVLGPTHTDFLMTFFNQIYVKGSKYPKWELRRDGSEGVIKSLIRPHAFSLPKVLTDKILPKVVMEPTTLKMPASCRAKEQELLDELEVELESGTTLYALSQSKLGQLIRQFASGAVYTNEERTTWEEVHDVKVRALQEHVDELQGAPILVFAWFRHSKERILRRFPDFEVLTGKAEQVRRWNNGDISGLIANPQGSGMGLNLQHGGADIDWFDPEWSREKLDQGNGRLARLGQLEQFVSARLPLIGRIDHRIWDRLQEKGADEEGLIESVALDLPDFY